MRPLTEEEIQEAIDADKYVETREEYCARMAKHGYQIVTPEGNELLLDIDTKEQYANFRKMYSRLALEYGVTAEMWPSKSGYPSRHILVKMPVNMTNPERIAFQAILGSDPIREMLSMFRHFCDDEHPTLIATTQELMGGKVPVVLSEEEKKQWNKIIGE